MRLDYRGEYVPTWSNVSREVKDAAGWRCVRCHHPFFTTGRPRDCDERCDHARGRHEPERPGLNYGVHHLDGNKGNNAWWNLLPLCNSCHLSIQAKVVPERPYLWEHSAWFKPYVAGFFAHFYAGQQISQAQATRELDRWLALGQPWREEVATHA